MSDARYDAIVIGGGVGGLVASTYLARAGRRVLLLEAEDRTGGSCRAVTSLTGVRASLRTQVLDAIDPRVVKELGLTRRGLRFAARDLSLMRLCRDGDSLALARDAHAAARAVATHSPADGIAYKHFQAEIFALARAMRPGWWENASRMPRPDKATQRRLLKQLGAASAVAVVNERFESEGLRAALAFGVSSPFEPGSALALVWRASQEMCGLQGAVAVPQGGPAALIAALVAAAQEAGAELRTKARASRLVLAGNAAAGVALDTGETVFARTVLSCLSRRDTLLDLAPTASGGFDETFALRRSGSPTGTASILFVLNSSPGIGGKDAALASRFVIADRIACPAANGNRPREGCLPEDLAIEAFVPTAVDRTLALPGQHLLSIRVHGVPLATRSEWALLSARLAERVVSALEPHAVHLRERIVGMDMCAPEEVAATCTARILSSYAERIATPIEGLFLCGKTAEPVDAISGRAGRIAANIANGWLEREKHP